MSEDVNRPEMCKHIAYSITPDNQPIIVGDTYYCKYCGLEIEPSIIMGVKIGWMHKDNGKFVNIDKEFRDVITMSFNRHFRNIILYAFKYLIEEEPRWDIDSEFKDIRSKLSKDLDTL